MLVDGYREIALPLSSPQLTLSRTSTLEIDVISHQPNDEEVLGSSTGTIRTHRTGVGRVLRFGAVLRRSGGRLRDGSISNTFLWRGRTEGVDGEMLVEKRATHGWTSGASFAFHYNSDETDGSFDRLDLPPHRALLRPLSPPRATRRLSLIPTYFRTSRRQIDDIFRASLDIVVESRCSLIVVFTSLSTRCQFFPDSKLARPFSSQRRRVQEGKSESTSTVLQVCKYSS